MNYAEVIGHDVTPATAAILDKLTEYVNRQHAQHPEIPESVFWDDIQVILTERIEQAEG